MTRGNTQGSQPDVVPDDETLLSFSYVSDAQEQGAWEAEQRLSRSNAASVVLSGGPLGL